LKELGKPIRVIDVFSVKPLDWQTIVTNAKETGNRIVVVEDHYPQGGIADALSNALLTHSSDEKFKFIPLSVNSLPMSGPPADLLARFKIDAAAVQEAVLSF
jgi:transketolase